MTQFKYRAIDHEGHGVEGTMEESSARRVTIKLQERGLTVNSVEHVHPELTLLRRSGAMTWQELETVTQALSAIIRSGLPLAPALKSMAADLQKPRLRRVLDRMHHELERGNSLEEAVSKEPAFPHVYQTLIRAGEAAGNLPGVMQMLCQHATRQVETRNALTLGLYYPALILVFSLAIFLILSLRVIPVFAEIFEEFGGELPAPTQFWLDMSAFLVRNLEYLPIALGVLAGCGVVLYFWLQRGHWRRVQWDRLRMSLPIWGHQRYTLAIGRFARTLGMLLYARVPVIDSLELAAAASGSPFLAQAVSVAALRVADGERIADSFASTRFFGHHFCWLLATGEERGHVEDALENAAAHYEREAEIRERTVAVLVTPVSIIILAIIVGSMILSLYLPIFTLGDQISQ